MVQFLDVDPRVVAALDRAQDDAAPRGVEERHRRRLVAAAVRVGVVADDRRLGDGVVDAPVDARQRRPDLVDGLVEIVDPPLERDGEVDEVCLLVAEQHELCPPDAAERQEVAECEEERCDGRHRGADRAPACDRHADVHHLRVKNTLYVAELFDVLTSPGTAPTSTLSVAFAPKAEFGRSKLENVTVCCCPGWISWIDFRRTIGAPPASIRSVTGTFTSWKSPEFWTVATKERSADTFTVAGDDVERSTPWGCERTETSPSPCLPLGVPPVEAPCRRWRRSPNERALTSSGLETKRESGTTTPVTACAFSWSVAALR